MSNASETYANLSNLHETSRTSAEEPGTFQKENRSNRTVQASPEATTNKISPADEIPNTGDVESRSKSPGSFEQTRTPVVVILDPDAHRIITNNSTTEIIVHNVYEELTRDEVKKSESLPAYGRHESSALAATGDYNYIYFRKEDLCVRGNVDQHSPSKDCSSSGLAGVKVNTLSTLCSSGNDEKMFAGVDSFRPPYEEVGMYLEEADAPPSYSVFAARGGLDKGMVDNM